jgi:hypothetical protein
LLFYAASQAAPLGVEAFNPAFDVTPARLVHSIITERGVVHPVTGMSAGVVSTSNCLLGRLYLTAGWLQRTTYANLLQTTKCKSSSAPSIVL